MAASTKNKGLGKGLGALLTSDAVQTADQRSIVELPLHEVNPNRDQPRQNFDEIKLQELANSIKENGIIQPLIVTRRGEGDYLIVAGERRWRAARLAGLRTVPCIIRELTPEEVLRQALIENVQRQDLNPIETAQALQRLQDDYHMTQEELSTNVGMSRSNLANTLRLLKLSEKVRNLVEDGSLTAGHARALLSLTDVEIQEKTAVLVAQKELSVRDTEKLVRKLNAPPRQVPEVAPTEPAYMLACQQLEEKLSRRLGTKVELKDREGKGRVMIEYYSLEDLERIVALISTDKQDA